MHTKQAGRIYRVEANSYSHSPAKISISIEFAGDRNQGISVDAPIEEMPQWSRLVGKEVWITLSIENK